MTRRKVTRMSDQHGTPDAGQQIAQQPAQVKLAQDELGADSGVKLTQDPVVKPKEKEQDGKEKDETEDDDEQELAQQLALIHLDNKTKSQKKRSKKKENMKKKKEAAEKKALEEKIIQEKEAEGTDTTREKEIREMAQKMADDIIKKMGVLQISEETTSMNTTIQTETQTAAKDMPPMKNKKLNVDKLFQDWSEYFGKGDLEDWQRLCRNLGLPGDLPTKTKCRDAVKGVHVNIRQFLDAQRKPEDVKFFKNVYKLANWTASKHLRVPLNLVPRGTPLRNLMRQLSRY